MGKEFNQYKKRITIKSIAVIVLLLFIFSLTIGVLGYNSITEAMLAQYSEGAFRTADIAASYVNGDDLEWVRESGGTTEEYKDLFTRFQHICNGSNATFVYVIQPDTSDFAHITFLISVSNKNNDFKTFDFGYYRETTNNDYREKYARLYDGSSERELVMRDRGYVDTDYHITAMIPLKSSAGETKGILCVQRQMEVLTENRHQYVNRLIMLIIFVSLLIMVIMTAFLNKSLLEPLSKITAESSRFAKENIKRERKLSDEITKKDEIGLLAFTIDMMEEKITDYVKDLTHITAERERISTELTLASRIQDSMLPNVFPAFPDRSEFNIYASMTPAKEVGGDFYDFLMIDDDHMAMVIADVSGKGIPAALFMMGSMISIRNVVRHCNDPAEALRIINAQICDGNKEEMFVSVWLGILNIRTGVLSAANAGHEYPIIMNDGDSFELLKDKHGLVIGAMDGSTYTGYELNLRHGARVFVYTDGLPEAIDPQQNQFGLDRITEILNDNKDKPIEELLGNIREAVNDFQAGEDQFDDLTMMCLEIT